MRGAITISDDDDARTVTRHVIASYGMDPESMQEQLDEDRVIITLTPTRVIAQG